jgi:uncharacterized iron-regulated membrane protein
MNQPPPRHPLFIAIAGIALAGAWGTGAYEAATGTSAALMAQADAPAAPLSAEECTGPRGPLRLLCVFEVTRDWAPQVADTPRTTDSSRAVPGSAASVRLAAQRDTTSAKRDLP